MVAYCFNTYVLYIAENLRIFLTSVSFCNKCRENTDMNLPISIEIVNKSDLVDMSHCVVQFCSYTKWWTPMILFDGTKKLNIILSRLRGSIAMSLILNNLAN